MKCPICESKQVNLFHDRVWDSKEAKVYRCLDCDLTFLFPQMTLEEERQFYENYNQHIVKRGLMALHDPRELHLKSKPIAVQRLQLIEGYFKEIESVCEIGSATGAFLEQLQHVSDRCAIETYSVNRDFSKQYSERQYEEIWQVPSGDVFDIICMFHTFEHIREPFLFLERCKMHLTNKGKILIEVPHIDDPLISLYDCKVYKDWYFQAMHPYIYSLRALQFLFNSAGFTVEKIIYKQRYGLDNHLTWLSRGKPGGDELFQKLFSSNREYVDRLEEIKMTDTIYLIASSNDGDTSC